VTEPAGASSAPFEEAPLPPLERSLGKLDYWSILEIVASMAGSEAGRDLVRGLRPAGSREAAQRLAQETIEASDLMERGYRLPASSIDSLETVVEALATGAVCLEPLLLRSAGEALTAFSESRRQAAALLEEHSCPGIGSLPGALPDLPAVASELLRITTPDGEISRDASSRLSKLSRTAERLRESLSKEIGKMAEALAAEGVLRDIPPSIRNGRFVLPVLAAKRSRVPGVVHDRSDTGGTVFVEPQALSEAGNRLQEVLVEVQQEQRRILRDATSLLRSSAEALRRGLEAAAALDSILARARFSREWETCFPDPGPMALRQLRHPLLPRGESVPNDLVLPGDWRVLVVSGPNAGGKSVLLKSAGLAVACAQSGLGACVSPGSTLPPLFDLRVSMGDSQSLVQKLSTYSARLAEELEMLRSADGRMLVLLDEPAAGTDPLPGAAMATALLESIASSGARAIVTTHLGQLKTLASDHEGWYNGSMNFDSATLAPDFSFSFGLPGSSFTLEIAGSMGFPESVLSRAQSLAGDAFVLDRLVSELARSAAESRLESEALEEARAAADSRLADLEELLRMQEAEAAASASEASRRLEGLLREIGSRADSLLSRVASGDADERREARAEIRRLEALGSSGARARKAGPEPKADVILEGGWAAVRGWKGGPGRIEKVRGASAFVRLGSVLVEKPLSDLTPVEAPRESRRPADYSCPAPSPEIDLRGRTSEEALQELDLRIDGCQAAGISRLRIIHGKGTGALMRAVTEFLRRDRRVGSAAMAEPAEGGTGVTIAVLRDGR